MGYFQGQKNIINVSSFRELVKDLKPNLTGVNSMNRRKLKTHCKSERLAGFGTINSPYRFIEKKRHKLENLNRIKLQKQGER